MKTVKWEVEGKGRVQTYPPKDGKLLTPESKVTDGMIVTAKSKDEVIRLRIIQEISTDIFKASIMGDYFLNTPEELNNGDEVSIDREHILWLHGTD